MLESICEILQSVILLLLVRGLTKQWETLRLVARMAAGADKEPDAAPDPERARKAAEAIDKFNDGIANILNYSGEAEK